MFPFSHSKRTFHPRSNKRSFLLVVSSFVTYVHRAQCDENVGLLNVVMVRYRKINCASRSCLARYGNWQNTIMIARFTFQKDLFCSGPSIRTVGLLNVIIILRVTTVSCPIWKVATYDHDCAVFFPFSKSKRTFLFLIRRVRKDLSSNVK